MMGVLGKKHITQINGRDEISEQSQGGLKKHPEATRGNNYSMLFSRRKAKLRGNTRDSRSTETFGPVFFASFFPLHSTTARITLAFDTFGLRRDWLRLASPF